MKLLTIIIALIVIFPLLFMVLGSFKQSRIVLGMEILLPTRFVFENWTTLMKADIWLWLLNSILTVSTLTILSVLFNSLAGFTFSKLNFKFKEVLFWTLISSMLIPGFVSIIPFYLTVRFLKLYDTRLALIIPFISSSFLIFFYRRFLTDYPNSLIESSTLEGASTIRSFFSIILPTTKAAISTMSILVFMGQWKAFLLPRILIVNKKLWTLTVGLTEYLYAISWGAQMEMEERSFGINYGVMMAGGTFSFIPILLLFFLLRKRFISSLEGSINT